MALLQKNLNINPLPAKYAYQDLINIIFHFMFIIAKLKELIYFKNIH